MMFELKFDIKKENGSVVNKKYDTASDFLQEVESSNSDLLDGDVKMSITVANILLFAKDLL